VPNIPLHGGDEPTPEAPKRSHKRKTSGTPRRSSQRAPRAPLETRIREALEALADWLRDRGDAELGGVLREDAPKMAAVLGRVAKLNPLAGKVVGVIADVLEPVRAFGPTLRVLWQRLLGRRERIQAEREALEGEEELTVTRVVAPEPEPGPQVAEPWRISP
jgi:hypothetical protein